MEFAERAIDVARLPRSGASLVLRDSVTTVVVLSKVNKIETRVLETTHLSSVEVAESGSAVSKMTLPKEVLIN